MNGQTAKERGGRAFPMAASQATRSSIASLLTAPSLTAMALILVLAGCSQLPDVPEWVNPTSWNPTGWVDGMFGNDVDTLPPAPKSASKTSPAPGADKPFPKLGALPPAPKTTSSAETREKLANSLVADRDNARYTKENLRAGDTRMAAAPPPPRSAPRPKAKPPAPSVDQQPRNQQLAAIPAAKGTAARPISPSLPAPPKPIARSAVNSSDLTRVPSIVQRRGAPPPPPTPVAEVSRRPIPQVIQKSAASVGRRQSAGLAALPTPPTAMTPAAPVAATPGVASSAPSPAMPVVAPLVAPKLAAPRLLPSSPGAATQIAALQSPSVQVNLPLGQDQSILAQTFASSLAAQGSPVVRQPGNIFNAPNAAPIQGQWPTNVPGIVQQAFNASLSGTDQGMHMGAGAGPMASPQMSNQAMRRLPGAPVLIRFRHGSTQLSGAEKRRLGQLASQARQQGKTIYVVGHASQRTGDMNYAKHKLVNFNVSLDRANRVAGELRRQGVASQQIVVQAKGDAEPLYFEFMPDGEAKNRRVEVFVR